MPTAVAFFLGVFMTPVATHFFYKYKMWKKYVNELKKYTNEMIKEWIRRGYKNTMELYDFNNNYYDTEKYLKKYKLNKIKFN